MKQRKSSAQQNFHDLSSTAQHADRITYCNGLIDKGIALIEHSRACVSPRDILAVVSILKSGQINDSSETFKLARDLKNYLGTQEVHLYPSGTRALIGALQTLKTDKSEYVVAPSYVCDDVLDSILACDLKPIICDVNPMDFNLDVTHVRNKLQSYSIDPTLVVAIIVPHMFGFPADVVALRDLRIPIIEDITHAIGSSINNQFIGTFGDITISSLHALKVFTAGEGGILFVNQREDLKIRNYGEHLSNINSALARSQLNRIDSILSSRAEIYRFYQEKTKDVFGERIRLQTRLRGNPTYFRFVFLLPENVKFDVIQANYRAAGIIVRKPVKGMLHRLISERTHDQYNHTEQIFERAISLPLHLKLKSNDLKKIIKVTKKIFSTDFLINQEEKI